jgi:hypothetical protein
MATCNSLPSRALSLLDMLRFHGWKLAGVLHDMAMVETGIQHRIQTELGAAQIEVTDFFLTTVILDVHNAVIACSPYPDMQPATEAARRSETLLRSPGRRLTLGEVEIVIRNVRETMIAELSKEQSVSVPRMYADFVDNEKLFGDDVHTAFPSARPDIRDAGICIAVGLDTAAVFHLMRAVEVALRALARERRVKLPKGKAIEFADWQEVITAVRTGVDKSFGQWKKGIEKSAALEFYGDVVNQFSGFKDAFRNHVMHARAAYGRVESSAILGSVRAFYQRLSSRLDESGKRIAWKRPR